MKRMNRKDRVLLERLETQYGTDALASMIIKLNNDGQEDAEEVVPGRQEMTSCEDAVLEYIKNLEGYRIRMREIHWDARNNSLHKLADALMSDLEDYEDAIAEDFMGLIGYRIKVGAVVPKLPKSTEFKSLINEILNDTLRLKSIISDLPAWSGIANLIDDCVHNLQKSKYLADLI